MRRLLALVAVIAGAGGGLALYRRVTATRREHVDLYFEDGSRVSVLEGTPDAARLLALSREALAAARG